jgi:hypothetical protein
MKKCLSILAIVAASSAQADEVKLGEPAYGGTGCPSGSATVELGPDGKTMKLHISQFKAEAGKGTGGLIDIKSCNIAMPVHIPQGIRIALLPITFKGTVALPAGAKSKLITEFFFAGTRGATETRTFTGPLSQEYQIETGGSGLVWSGCGQDTNIRINTSVSAQTSADYEPATITLNELSEFNIQTKECN